MQSSRWSSLRLTSSIFGSQSASLSISISSAKHVPGFGLSPHDRRRFESIDWEKNNDDTRPGDPYPFQGGTHPFPELLEQWTPIPPAARAEGEEGFQQSFRMTDEEAFVWLGPLEADEAGEGG